MLFKSSSSSLFEMSISTTSSTSRRGWKRTVYNRSKSNNNLVQQQKQQQHFGSNNDANSTSDSASAIHLQQQQPQAVFTQPQRRLRLYLVTTTLLFVYLFVVDIRIPFVSGVAGVVRRRSILAAVGIYRFATFRRLRQRQRQQQQQQGKRNNKNRHNNNESLENQRYLYQHRRKLQSTVLSTLTWSSTEQSVTAGTDIRSSILDSFNDNRKLMSLSYNRIPLSVSSSKVQENEQDVLDHTCTRRVYRPRSFCVSCTPIHIGAFTANNPNDWICSSSNTALRTIRGGDSSVTNDTDVVVTADQNVTSAENQKEAINDDDSSTSITAATTATTSSLSMEDDDDVSTVSTIDSSIDPMEVESNVTLTATTTSEASNYTFSFYQKGDGSEDDVDRIPIRYMRMQSNNRIKAKHAADETIQWRLEHNIDTVVQRPHIDYDICKASFPHYFAGYDVNNNVVFVQRPALLNLDLAKKNNLSNQGLLDHYVYVNEYLWQVVEGDRPLGTMTSVIDLHGLKLSILRQGEILSFLKVFVATMDHHFPQRANTTLLLNAPKWFHMIYKLISPMMRESTKEKIKILSNGIEQDKILMEHLSKECIETLPDTFWSAAKIKEDKSLSTSTELTHATISPLENQLREFTLARIKDAGLEMASVVY